MAKNYNVSRVTPDDVRLWKGRRPRPLVLTATDYPTARIVEEAGVEMIHVGDSLAMVALGYSDTTMVSLEEMLMCLRAVARGSHRALITADVPACAMLTPAEAARAARLLVQNGAHAVKLEGGRDIADHLRAVREEGIALQGHVGLLPQRALAEGGYRRRGQTPAEADAIFEDALFLQDCGCFSIVVECVFEDVARRITNSLSVPTIGIYSGAVCDAEIRVLHDVVGLNPWIKPRTAKSYADVSSVIILAIKALQEHMNRA